MRATTSTRTLAAAAAVALSALLLAPGVAIAASECNATVSGMLMKQQERGENAIEYIYKVDVRAPLRCANVDFDVVVTEQTRGETVESRIRRRARVRDGQSNSLKVNHKVNRGTKVLHAEYEVASCQPCGSVD